MARCEFSPDREQPDLPAMELVSGPDTIPRVLESWEEDVRGPKQLPEPFRRFRRITGQEGDSHVAE